MTRQAPTLWDADRMTFAQALDLTIGSLDTYGRHYKHWSIAFSGGKDSTATVTLVVHLLESGAIPMPESLTVCYADTRMELTPLHIGALHLLSVLRERGIQTQVVVPPLDDRFFVYMFGRGVPPPKNRFRWCTPHLKVEPMLAALEGLRASSEAKLLLLTGVRIGESAARDQRIALSCGKDGAECGQGWFQETTPEAVADTLAPLLHWRVCHVWDWLTFHAPTLGFPTALLAEVYGGEEAQEVNARTGCVGCNLASRDTALDIVLKSPQWSYLAPLKRLRPLYQELIKPQFRLRKDGSQRLKDGSLGKNPMRLGPLTMEARAYGLAQVLRIQDEINTVAARQGRPLVDLINAAEEQRIHELIDANTWPARWTGEEVPGDVALPQVITAEFLQPLLGLEAL